MPKVCFVRFGKIFVKFRFEGSNLLIILIRQTKHVIPPESLPSYRLWFYKREMPPASLATFYQEFCADKFSPKDRVYTFIA